MEPSGSRADVGEGGVAVLRKSLPPRPTLSLPPRNPGETFLRSSDGSTPSPMTFVSSFLAEQEPYADSHTFSQLLAGAMTSPMTLLGDGLGEPSVSMDSDHSGRLAARHAGAKVGGPESPESLRSNSARFKAMMPSRIPISRPPLFTIPPGLSPTTLLDSPVLLRTGQAEPSPTTGTFPSYIQESGSTDVPESDSFKERRSEQEGFVFKPQPQLARNSLPPLPSMGFLNLSHQYDVPQAQTKTQLREPSGISRNMPESASMLTSLPLPSFSCANLVTPSQREDCLDSTTEPAEPSDKVPTSQMQAPAYMPPVVVERPSEDGYNWRKYGQKQVKGSEYPRSYYKCTSPNCPVKKKVERSYDGQVTEIVYKGEHNHAKPQATRRGMSGAHNAEGAAREASNLMTLEGADTSNGAGRPDSDRVSADPSQSRDQLIPYTGGTPELSLASISDDEGEDGEASKAEDGAEDEPDSKRRRVEADTETMAGAPLRTIREPRVVVQTTSEVDILDDGYRWRKYGQKVVKGNPYPRSYYKCTNSGCTVRKHVERSSSDPKAVITTYEGKHNHDVPAAKNSNHDTSGAAAASALPSSGPRLGASSANALVRPSLSLQEQLISRLYEENLRTEDKMAVEVGLGGGGFMNGIITGQSSNRGADPSAQSAMSLMSSGLTGVRRTEGFELIGQGFGLKPKEEPGDGLPFGNSLQPVLSSSSSYAI